MSATITEERVSAPIARNDLVRNDLRFEHAIRRAGLTTNNISCECRQGRLTLTGCVPSFFEKQLAQEAVRAIPGVRRICNELVVRG